MTPMKHASRALLYTAAILGGLAVSFVAVFPLPVLGDEVDTYSTTPGNNNSASPDGS